MKIPQMIAAEFRRLFSTPMAVIALIALLSVPILYGGLYLWANQDPYSKLDQVPVALVSLDTGGDVAGEHKNLGDEVVRNLLDTDSFGWSQVDQDEAKRGLDQGRFDFAVELPSDFTEAIASISSASPRQANIRLLTNDANNYLASTIGTQAVEKIRTMVTKQIVRASGATMLDALNTIRINMVDASNGAGQLVDGLGTAKDGSSQLRTGSTQLASGLDELHGGAGQLASGTSTLSNGLHELSAGAAQVAGGTAQLATVADSIDDSVTGVTGQIPEARAEIRQELVNQGLDEDQISRIMAPLDRVGNDIGEAGARVTEARNQIDTLNNGAHQVSQGVDSAAAGAATAADGASQLNAASGTAAAGAATLRDGAGQLDDGIAQLQTGATTLRDGLSDGANKLPNNDAQTRKAQADTLSAPVDVTRSSSAEAQNYGAGLAPFFAALAGWIGIYALFLIVKPISRRAVTALHSPIRVTLAGWATPALLGGVQMLGLFGILALALGFKFPNPLASLGILLAAVATYSAIILALNVWLGSVGQFVGLVLMVLQLVTAGGTFPWQTLPPGLRELHHVLPMGYVVDAMRQVMYSGDISRAWLDLSVLLMWCVIALLLAMIGVTRMTHRRTMRDLQPSLIG